MQFEYWHWQNHLSLEDRKKIIDYIENNYDYIEHENSYNKNYLAFENEEKI